MSHMSCLAFVPECSYKFSICGSKTFFPAMSHECMLQSCCKYVHLNWMLFYTSIYIKVDIVFKNVIQLDCQCYTADLVKFAFIAYYVPKYRS